MAGHRFGLWLDLADVIVLLPCTQNDHWGFRPSSVAAAAILDDAAASPLNTSRALRNAAAASAFSPSTTRERMRRVQPSTSRGEVSSRFARPSTIDRMAASRSAEGMASDAAALSSRGPSPLLAVSVAKDEVVDISPLSAAFALASS